MSSLTTLLKAKQPLLFLPLVFWLAAASFLSGCGNSDSNSSTQVVATTENERKAATPPPAGNLNIASLFIEADSFLRLRSGEYKKLVFQMYYVKDSNSLRAVVFPAKNKNTEFDTSRMQILKWRKDSIDIEGTNMFLGDQQTRGEGNQNDFMKLVKEIKDYNDTSTSAKITYVVFDPYKVSTDNNRFIYKMYGITDRNVKGSDINIMALNRATSTFETNPSPPARPD